MTVAIGPLSEISKVSSGVTSKERIISRVWRNALGMKSSVKPVSR